jgi:hypothetical protein
MFGVWSVFSFAGKVVDFSNADVAVDQYHRFEVSLPKSTQNVLYA